MRRNRRWTVEEKLTIVLKHLIDEQSLRALAHKYGTSHRIIGSWVEKYNTLGAEGLKRKCKIKATQLSRKRR